MTVRNKLFLMMSFVICLMAAVFFILANTYLGGLFKQYGEDARTGSANQVARLLSYYYQDHHDAWTGVDTYINGFFQAAGSPDRSPMRPEYMVLLDTQNHVLAVIGPHIHPTPPDPSLLMSDGGVKVPIHSNGQTVGTLWIRDRGVQVLYSVQQRVLHTITLSTLWGAIVTGALALMIAAWFARRVTMPLKHIERAIQGISSDNLETHVPIESRDEFGTVANALNQMSQRLHRTEQARRHLVADVAHELRTPLTVIQGQLESIQQGVKQPKPEALLPIYDEVIRLSRLVEDLHELSLAEVGKLPLKESKLDLVQLVLRVVDNFQWEAEDRGIKLTVEGQTNTGGSAEDEGPDAAQAWVNVDAHRMTQVFVNLIGNAIYYTSCGGEVSIRLHRRDGDVGIEVRDTGPGIAAEHLPYIFDRFYRAEDDRSRGSGGMGLGLSIAKEYVEAHGGHIVVDSEEGHGTSFTVWQTQVEL